MARDFNAKNIIVGAATFYVGKAGEEQTKIVLNSASATAQDPTKVVASASAYWYHLGYTQNGVTMNIQPTYGEVTVDQLLDVAKMFKSGQQVTVATSLTEGTLENLYVAIGGRTGANGDIKLNGNLDSASSVVSADSGPTNLDSGAASLYFSASSAASVNAGSVAGVLDINGGSLGYEPVERSVLFVGPGPSNLVSGTTNKAERVYIGYRAVSMDAVGVAVQRDNATLFPVNFRMLPSSINESNDGNAAYGKIIDRVYV